MMIFQRDILEAVRGVTWNLRRSFKFNTLKQQSANGRAVRIPQFPVQLWSWEWTWNYIKDNPDDRTVNAVYSDLEQMWSKLLALQGPAQDFLYQPGASTVYLVSVNATGSGTAVTYHVKTSGQTQPYHTFKVGQVVTTRYFANAAFNGTFVIIATTSTTFNVASTAAGSETAAGVATATVLSPSDRRESPIIGVQLSPVSTPLGTGFEVGHYIGTSWEPIQALANDSPDAVYLDGAPVAYLVQPPSSQPGMLGYALTNLADDRGAVTIDATWYYRVALDDDVIDFGNFMFQLWQCKSLKFSQVRL